MARASVLKSVIKGVGILKRNNKDPLSDKSQVEDCSSAMLNERFIEDRSMKDESEMSDTV